MKDTYTSKLTLVNQEKYFEDTERLFQGIFRHMDWWFLGRRQLWRAMFLTLTIGMLSALGISAKTLHVGTGFPYTVLTQATAVALPGDTVLVHAGNYAGGLSISNLQGTSTKWIFILAAPNETVTFVGGGNAWQLSDAQYVHIRGFTFQQQTGNGFNIDDGGTFDTPSHHIVFEACIFQNINATGNNDLLKMSGIDDFEVKACRFLNGSAGGSGIDMVGCHKGNIHHCHFENQGSNSIQAKGGSRDIRIAQNLFKNGGLRALNLGGSTGLAFFRPIDATHEAAELKVYANMFVGSQAPIAFVGCIDSEVINNTFYLPTKWVMRILQETVDLTRFAPCGRNAFKNNIIFHDSQVATDCNIGPNTDPASFTFANNLWFHSQNATWNGPVLPSSESNRVLGNPLFANALIDDFSLQTNSPAIGKGSAVADPIKDFTGVSYALPRSIGAFEGKKSTGLQEEDLSEATEIQLFPNPFREKFWVASDHLVITSIEIFNTGGKLLDRIGYTNGLISKEIDLSAEAKGLYIIRISTDKGIFFRRVLNQ